MARRKDKEKVLKLRLAGKSYAEIKKITGISKSTLSGWLHKFPLSPEQMKKVRDFNPQRIERFRNTMRKKREQKLETAYNLTNKDIGFLTEREKFIAGFFLYWGEGGKTKRSTVALSNTDPAMLRFFLEWLSILKVGKKKIKIRLQLYSDMNIRRETRFWVKKLRIPENQFRKPYIKKSEKKAIWHRGGYGHGACIVIFENQVMTDYVLMGLRHFRKMYGEHQPLREVQ